MIVQFPWKKGDMYLNLALATTITIDDETPRATVRFVGQPEKERYTSTDPVVVRRVKTAAATMYARDLGAPEPQQIVMALGPAREDEKPAPVVEGDFYEPHGVEEWDDDIPF